MLHREKVIRIQVYKRASNKPCVGFILTHRQTNNPSLRMSSPSTPLPHPQHHPPHDPPSYISISEPLGLACCLIWVRFPIPTLNSLIRASQAGPCTTKRTVPCTDVLQALIYSISLGARFKELISCQQDLHVLCFFLFSTQHLPPHPPQTHTHKHKHLTFIAY